ncbi:MAG TPA: POTRA domain-containing protein [Candidatus Acidoferrales bacterium]|nr:POTRA domain-containing protein [Candidatus Acidoferrales bacterium]
MHSSRRVRFYASFLLLSFVLLCAAAHAQDASLDSAGISRLSYEGQTVSSMDFAGRTDVDPSALEQLVAQKVGQPYSAEKVDASAEALKRAGNYENVTIETRPEANGVRVVFVLHPALYVGIYEFPGALRGFNYSRLLQVTNYTKQEPYSPEATQRAQENLLAFLRRSGYFQSKVNVTVESDHVHELANIIFNVDLGPRAKFGNLTMEGATPEETAKLQKALRGIRARLRGATIKRGKTYSYKRLQTATQHLENQLHKQKRLAASVKLVGADYDPETNLANITFEIKTGPIVKVQVSGAHLSGGNRRKLIPVYDEGRVDDELIQEGRNNIRGYLQTKGYFDAKVDARVARQGEDTTTVTYAVTKGARHRVGGVRFEGNEVFSDKQLSSHSSVTRGRFLSHGKFSEALLRRTVRDLSNLYKNAGYSQVKVTPDVKRAGNIDVVFHIIEGQQDKVANLRIEGNDTVPVEELAPKGLKLTPGKPYSDQLLQQDRNSILAKYLELGYLTASFVSTAKPEPGDKHAIDVVYTIQEGPQVHTATVITTGRDRTKQALTEKAANIKPGRPLSEDAMLKGESRLYTLGVFDWAEVDPRRPITNQSEEDVLVKVHESKRNSITYGFGFEVVNRGGNVPSGTVTVPGLPPVGLPTNYQTSEQTFWGPRGTFEYTRRNIRGNAESLTFGALAGRLDQRGQLTYLDPYFRGSSWRASTAASVENNLQNPIFNAVLGQGGFQLQKDLDAKRTKYVILRYSFQYTSINDLLIPDLVPPQDRNVRFSSIAASWVRDTRDSVLDAQKGIYESFELDFNPSFLGSSVDFARFLGQTAYYKNIGGGFIYANSIRLGLEEPFNGSFIPLSENFFTGGGSTLRGFPLNGAGPQRPVQVCGKIPPCSLISVPVGGPQLFIVNSELRTPQFIPVPFLKKIGLAAFYDGGNVYDRIGFKNFFTDFSNTVGGGVRYKTPIGPIRIDIGHNLNSPRGIKSTQIFVTLGQAF